MGAISRDAGSVILWVCFASFTYGFHIAALNAPQRAMTCQTLSSWPPPSNFPSCIPLTLNEFGYVTSAFILGGLISCILTSTSFTFLRPSQPLKSRFVLCAAISLAGSVLQAGATGFNSLALGRAMVGFGAAGGIGLVPPALGELAPAHLKGSIGVLHQLSIVVGILVAQALGLGFSAPTLWRYIPLVSAAVSLLQILSAPLVTVSSEDSNQRTSQEGQAPDEEALLPASSSPGLPKDDEAKSLFEPSARKGSIISLVAMLVQQGSGINAVLFYSTTLLTPLLPSQAPFLAFYLTAFNVLMTFPPIYLVHSLGPRRLLLLSITAMCVSCVELGWAINSDRSWPAAAGVFFMIGSFAIGLGPVPFLLPPLLSPANLVPQLSSVALLLNFVSNLAIGSLFLPVRDALSKPVGGGREGEGNVFFLFAGVLALGGVVLARFWRG